MDKCGPVALAEGLPLCGQVRPLALRHTRPAGPSTAARFADFGPQVVRVGQRIATIDVRLKDAANRALVAQVRRPSHLLNIRLAAFLRAMCMAAHVTPRCPAPLAANCLVTASSPHWKPFCPSAICRGDA